MKPLLNTHAVVLHQPQQLGLSALALQTPGEADLVVDIEFSGISTGTERMLFNGQMPGFPGMGYPLVPGDESVGVVRQAGPKAQVAEGQRVFVPGAHCFGNVRGLQGSAASRLVVAADRVIPLPDAFGHDGKQPLGEQAVLLALAATAYHAVAGGGKRAVITPPELIVGHGVLGRLLARLTVAAGLPAPTVWESNPGRVSGAEGYVVTTPEEDTRCDYRAIYDVSGDARILDTAIARLAKGGEVVLAGFYSQPLSFNFAPAFMREAQIRAAAEWQRADMLAVRELLQAGRFSLDGLITHHDIATNAEHAYRTAFGDVACLKMILDWRPLS